MIFGFLALSRADEQFYHLVQMGNQWCTVKTYANRIGRYCMFVIIHNTSKPLQMRSESFTELNPAVTVLFSAKQVMITRRRKARSLEEKDLRHLKRYSGIQKSESTMIIWDSESSLDLKIVYGFYHWSIILILYNAWFLSSRHSFSLCLMPCSWL